MLRPSLAVKLHNARRRAAADRHQSVSPKVERSALFLVVGVLAVDRQRDAGAGRGAMVGNVPEHDRRHAQARHAGQRRAPQIMRRPWGYAEAPERSLLADFIGAQDRPGDGDRRKRALSAGK